MISNKQIEQFDWFVEEALYNYFKYGEEEVAINLQCYIDAKDKYSGKLDVFVINLTILKSQLLKELYL